MQSPKTWFMFEVELIDLQTEYICTRSILNIYKYNTRYCFTLELYPEITPH